MTTPRRFFLATPLIALALALSGCADGEDRDATDGTAAEESTPGQEPQDPAPTEEPTSQDPGGSGTITVERTGGNGPIGLSTAEDPGGEVTTVSGTLIVGPGSCFSLQPNGQPHLLVFGDDAQFEVGQGRPAVTTDDLGTLSVGTDVDLSVVQYSQGEVEGIPQRCTHGAADTVLIVVG